MQRRSESMCALGGKNSKALVMPSGRVVSRSSLKTEESNNSDRSLSLKRNVSFNTIEINEFPMEVGDNPSARGVPVQIGWESQMNTVFDLEEYETCKPEPRDRASMMIPPKNRMELAREQGLTMREIMSVTREANKIKMYRSKSVENMNWDAFNENLEKTTRKLKKIAAKVPTLTRRLSPDSVTQVEEPPKVTSGVLLERSSLDFSSTVPVISEAESSEETTEDFRGISF
jgi:hypothetical protein